MDSPADGVFRRDWFLNVKEIVAPKSIDSLAALTDEIFQSQADRWRNNNQTAEGLKQAYSELLQTASSLLQQPNGAALLSEEIKKYDNQILYGTVRALHLRVHMSDLDKLISDINKPRVQIKKPGETTLLDSKLILQSFLDYLQLNGPTRYSEWIGSNALRLVSTVHPNETERNTNLMHYASIFEKYTEWKKNYDSLQLVATNAPEYRLRRETLNQLRRAIKAEIEGIWQSDQLRHSPIPVQSEAQRILERYKVIFKAFPLFLKFVKQLAKEAYFLYMASEHAKDEKWISIFKEEITGNSREDKLRAIKRTFRRLGKDVKVPRILTPVITFGTWKGGDRDGNPFVVASFTNQTLVDQKEFVLRQYISHAVELVDKLTPSIRHLTASKELSDSVYRDSKIFPYITSIKPGEPYRTKMRYMLEKLQNTLARVLEVKKQAGETVKPLLGLTTPGPSGYNNVEELRADIEVLYRALLHDGGKSQARSYVQDLHILIHTFGLHLTSIDFRQTSDKNTEAVQEYLKVIGHESAGDFIKMPEKARQMLLLELILSKTELDPWIISTLSKTTRDTFETLTIFADAAKTDPDAVGKFIISMCQYPSDIMTVLFLMKLSGMLDTDGKKITRCPFDVSGLFETIKDLVTASSIIEDLLAINVIRDYVVQHRGGKITCMLGYSDSVRDGSSLASDAQIISTSIQLRQLQERFTANGQPISICFYRGRGDTLPRGFGGSITKAICSQLISSPSEDHTEQNRYLRRYFSVPSAVDHLHVIYSAHLSCRLSTPPAATARYQQFFNLFGRISTLKWRSLVAAEEGSHGRVYFELLTKHSILPHLPRSYFASRPVARDGITYNIDKIRAIPFTLALGQIRDFSSGYYGTGTGFDYGIALLDNPQATSLELLQAVIKATGEEEAKKKLQTDAKDNVIVLVKALYKTESTESLLAKAKSATPHALLPGLLGAYGSPLVGANEIAELLLHLRASSMTALDILREMLAKYAPFRHSLENKETSLLVHRRDIVAEYTKDASEEEKRVLKDTDDEAELAKRWLLQIMQQENLESKTIRRDWASPELYLLHTIQAQFLREYKALVLKRSEAKTTEEKADLSNAVLRKSVQVQMTILAVSEALGFAG